MERSFLNLVGNTPEVLLEENHRNKIYGKLEFFNPTNSIKDRAAKYVLDFLLQNNIINNETKIIESSSGNFGVALSHYCRERNLDFYCVIDPKILPMNKKIMEAFGTNLISVTHHDAFNNFLVERIATVKRFIQNEPNSYWINQYENPLVIDAYKNTLSKEILISEYDYVFVAVSSCGTIKGIIEGLKESNTQTKVIAVDVEGSLIFGETPLERNIPGIGSNRKSKILKPEELFDQIIVSENSAISGCKELLKNNCLLVGGSSGAVFSAVKQYINDKKIEDNKILCLFPDSGYKYMDLIY